MKPNAPDDKGVDSPTIRNITGSYFDSNIELRVTVYVWGVETDHVVISSRTPPWQRAELLQQAASLKETYGLDHDIHTKMDCRVGDASPWTEMFDSIWV